MMSIAHSCPPQSKQLSLSCLTDFGPERKLRAYFTDQASEKVETAALLQKPAGIPGIYLAFIQQIGD